MSPVLLAFDAVVKRYARPPREVVALDGVGFELEEGERLGVLGSARSGKSALLRLAAGLELPDAGAVRIRGRDTRELSRREQERMLRHEIGCVWESAAGSSRVDVVEYIAWPLLSAGVRYRDAISQARDMLRRVGSAGSGGARLGELAASELTRVSLAQALVRRPRLLLADEPAKTLDPVERTELLRLLDAVSREQGIALLLTAGEATGVVASSRLALLDRGRFRLRPRAGGDVVPLGSKRRRPTSV